MVQRYLLITNQILPVPPNTLLLLLLLYCCIQEQVSGGTTTTVLRNLNPNTEYRVTLLPVYDQDVEGKRQSENGKTST